MVQPCDFVHLFFYLFVAIVGGNHYLNFQIRILTILHFFFSLGVDAVNELLLLGPFELKNLLHHLLSRKEFSVDQSKGKRKGREREKKRRRRREGRREEGEERKREREEGRSRLGKGRYLYMYYLNEINDIHNITAFIRHSTVTQTHKRKLTIKAINSSFIAHYSMALIGLISLLFLRQYQIFEGTVSHTRDQKQ